MLTTISRLLPTVTPTDFRVWDRAKPNGLGVADFEGAIQINICVWGGTLTDFFRRKCMFCCIKISARFTNDGTQPWPSLCFLFPSWSLSVLRSMGKLYARKMFRGTIEIFLSKCKSP